MSAVEWRLKLILMPNRNSKINTNSHGTKGWERSSQMKMVADEINKDLLRVFPNEVWFIPHLPRIRNVLMWYARYDTSLSYAQPMAFVAFTLYYVFHKHNELDSMAATYNALKRLIEIVRPAYPISVSDPQPLLFNTHIKKIVSVKVLKIDTRFKHILRSDTMDIVLLSGVSTFFTNWFDIQNSVKVLDYIIHSNKTTMFTRLVNFIVAIFIANDTMFLNLSIENSCALLTSRSILSAEKIISHAKTL